MALYSVLAGRGTFDTEKLLTYKATDGLPAHCDRKVPGVDSDSGSLGQGLSKAIGVAISNRNDGLDYPVFAILGDGELQEGQLFEAFLTLKKFELDRCITIIDRNFLQSDSQTRDIKDAHDWSRLFTHMGLNCMTVNGHDFQQIDNAIKQGMRMNAPLVIIAETIKGGGAQLTSMGHKTPRREGIWHGRIPDIRQYIGVLKELVLKTQSTEVYKEFEAYLKNLTQNREEDEATAEESTVPATGSAFAAVLAEAVEEHQNLYVLDADLEKSCHLTEVAGKVPSRFIEVGISEQDMCSIAAGLALSGKIPVVNTYASFYKRSLDQIYNAVTEKLPIIFAGHYAGADYFTDGKSHQAVNDIGLLRSLGEIEVFEPYDAVQTAAIFAYLFDRMGREWQESRQSMPAYIRLHRTPAPGLPKSISSFAPHTPHIFKSTVAQKSPSYLFVSGPHVLLEALKAAKELSKENICLNVVAVSHYSDEKAIIKKLIEKADKIFTLEDHRRETGLGSFIAAREFRNPVRIGVNEYLQSSLSKDEMFARHALTAETVCHVVRKVLSCKHNK
jgi:transketolase